jgi:hypothetical protein
MPLEIVFSHEIGKIIPPTTLRRVLDGKMASQQKEVIMEDYEDTEYEESTCSPSVTHATITYEGLRV